MRHVYLSPHLDDAVLSCGGAIHRQVVAGDRVLVLTLLAGDAAVHGVSTPSEFALVQHGYWGNPPRPIALRRAEDAAALTWLGADWYHLGYLDAVYRAGASGEWLYRDLETLFGEVHADDPLALGTPELTAQLAGLVGQAEPAIVYSPLAAGRHVDHQIMHTAARGLAARGYRVAFYEDYPYSAQEAAVRAGLQAAGLSGARPELLPLEAPDVAAWVSAVAYYRTQLGILFRGADAMPGHLWSFAATRSHEAGLAVRVWWPDVE
jgi:LmbE family N-acetylglucosaminyl deacetylase